MKYHLLIAIFFTMLSSLSADEQVILDKLEFDPARYIDVDELSRGMKGYGLTVFDGTKIEKFAVEVVSVMTAKSAGRSAFLIKVVDEPRFDIAKGVHGCSGSPVFFNGRMAGAMSFGWTFQEEPLYGVTPIKQMLNSYKRALAAETAKADRNKSAQEKLLSPDIYTRLMAPEVLQPQDWQRINSKITFGGLDMNSGPAGSKPLTSGLSIGGLPSGALGSLKEYMPGLTVNTGVFSTDISKQLTEGRPVLERGSTIVIPLINGDIEACTLGTVTEVIDEWVFAFGHSFNGNGPCQWPMATGYIHTFVSGFESSFKLGQAVDIVGTVEADEIMAICGRIGKTTPTTPAKTIVHFEPVGETIEFNMNLVQDESYASTMAVISAIGPAQYRGAMPNLCTVEYNVDLNFGQYGQIHISDISSEYSTAELTSDIATACSLMTSSPWDEVKLEKIVSEIRVNDSSIAADIEKVDISRLTYEPGETITADIELFRYRNEPVKQQATITLPADLKPGIYKLAIGGKRDYLATLSDAQPYRGNADKTSDIVKVLRDRFTHKRNNIFMTIVNNQVNLAIEQKPLGELPASKSMLLLSNARQLMTTQYNEIIESITPCDYVIFGRKQFEIEVTEKKTISKK